MHLFVTPRWFLNASLVAPVVVVIVVEKTTKPRSSRSSSSSTSSVWLATVKVRLGKWCQIYKSKSNVFIHNDSILVHEYIHSHATTTLWLNIHRFRFNDIIILSYEYIHLLSLHIFIHTQNQNFYSTRLQYLFNFFKGSKIHKFHFLHIKRINSFCQIYIHLHSRHYISVWI